MASPSATPERLLATLADRAEDTFVASSRLLNEAHGFARGAHAGQRQEADGSPYIEHPLAVARLLHAAGCDEEVVAAGLLHDVVEDTLATLEDVRERFGPRVAHLVGVMTEQPELQPFERRKAIHRATIARAGREAEAIFAADKLANAFTLRVAIRRRGTQQIAGRLSRRLSQKLAHYEATLHLIERKSPPTPFATPLRTELKRLQASQRRSHRDPHN